MKIDTQSGKTEKHTSVITLLRELSGRLKDCPFLVVDRWDGDLCAIGIASPTAPGRLVYVNTHGMPTDRAYADVEFPPLPDEDLPYRQGPKYPDLTFDELATLIRQHFRGEEPRE